MAVHDDRRTPRDYIRNARSRYDTARPGSSWAVVVFGLAILALIAYMLFSVVTPDRTGDGTQPTGTTTAPKTAPTTQPK